MASEISGATASSPQRRRKLTVYAIPILTIHVLALLAFVPMFFSWWGLAALIIGIYVYGQGINLGYHRLLAHRSLKVPKWIERSYVILALCCLEETPAKWVSTHRLHHAHSDENEDPHSPTRTFFWSHMGWLLTDVPHQNQLAVHMKYAADLIKDPFYRYLEKAWWFSLLLLGAQMAIYYFLGYGIALLGLGGDSPAWLLGTSMLIWGVLLRLVMVWHLTWSVNSLGHVFGYRNYSTNENSRNNWLVALLASGEGWHNNHHHDPASASVQHRWWEVDVTYYQILILEKLGLAKDVVRPRHVRHRERVPAANASRGNSSAEPANSTQD